MKLVSWNVNGIRAVAKKGLSEIVNGFHADVICFQETKATAEQVQEVLSANANYQVVANEAERKGYSGTAIMSKVKPLSVKIGMGIEEHDKEGRVIAAEFEKLWLVTVYTPNSGNGLARLDYRQTWDADFIAYLKTLEATKPVVVCGDLNVAHQPIDIARPKSNYNKTAGYTQQEIDGMTNLLNAGFIDSYRYQHPDTVKYSWWSYRGGAKENNIGWRLDYFLISESLKASIDTTEIRNDIEGSDHCPVELVLNV